MFQDMELLDLLKKQKEGSIDLIDVRSPQEFADFRIPGSINIPVFDNAERAEVGTIYKQIGPEAAKEKGLEIFSAKLPAFISHFQSLGKERIVYCWRGGMRSKTAATVVDLMELKVSRLNGGIRSYRQWVVKQLETQQFIQKMYVLNGFTGTGKTILLHRLKKVGCPVLDLEGMANHRGSIFGQIGLTPNNQKTFESLLVQEMVHYDDAPFILLEGESKRIGKATLPASLYDAKENSVQIFIHLPVEKRIENILREYHPDEHRDGVIEAFHRIQRHIHTPIAKEIDENLKTGNFASAVKLLLEYYYDPRYEHTLNQYPDDKQVHIYADDLDEAFEKLLSLINSKEKCSFSLDS
jgi:tRNA 2-selenouridine synthase